MTRIFFPNLMFEEELSGSLRSATAASKRIVAELGPVMGLLAEHGNSDDSIVLVGPDAIPGEIPQSLKHVRFATLDSMQAETPPDADFVPWGWSRPAILAGHRLKLSFEAPDPDVVRLINSRQFSAEFDWCFPVTRSAESELFGRVCSSMGDVSRALELYASQTVSKWVIKANLSQAARNRLMGSGSVPDEPQQAWLRQRFCNGEVVYAEPWVERLAECGLQFTVSPLKDGEPEIRFDGAAEMLTDAVGRYRGSILQSGSEGQWWWPAVSHCRSIANRARELGFSGAIGMDCMLFRNPVNGKAWLRVCHDVNGRRTMGRVALSLKQYLHSGEIGFWCHAPAGIRGQTAEKTTPEFRNPFDSVDAQNVRIVQTSPCLIGSQPVKLRTALLISEDCGSLTQVARKILNQDIRGPFSSL